MQVVRLCLEQQDLPDDDGEGLVCIPALLPIVCSLCGAAPFKEQEWPQLFTSSVMLHIYAPRVVCAPHTHGVDQLMPVVICCDAKHHLVRLQCLITGYPTSVASQADQDVMIMLLV